jgi:hypothetical protein
MEVKQSKTNIKTKHANLLVHAGTMQSQELRAGTPLRNDGCGGQFKSSY